MTPGGRVVDVSAEETVRRRSRTEDQVLAAVIATDQTWLAGPASDMRLDGHAVAYDELGDGRMHGDDHACGLVAQDVWVGDFPGPDAAMFPEVDVGTTTVLADLAQHTSIKP